MTALEIVQLATGISTLIPMALATALKIQALLTPLGPDIQVNIKSLEDTAISEDDAAMADANAWLVAHGFPPRTPSTPPTS
jgi:hypothetical protein